jgi:FHA domain/zinc-ribbon domain
MTACPQCGTPYKPGDKFCNTCGTPIVQRAGGPGPSQGGGGPAYAQGGYGGGPPGGGFGGAGPRCQMGHEIAPGASYCAQGHPIALDAMQFANDAYGPGFGGNPAPGGGYPAPQQNYGPPPGQPGFGGGAPGYGGDPGYGGGYGGGAPQPGYGGAPSPGYAPGGPPPIPAGGGYAPQPAPYGGAAPQPGFDAPVPAKILRGFLVAYQTNATGDYWALNAGRLTVGRAGAGENIDIPLADPTISSRHAVLVVDGPAATVTVEDTGSTNGTFVNDEHLGFNGRRDLRDGDRLRFGGFTCVVKLIGRV